MGSVTVREALAHAEAALKKGKTAGASKILRAIGDERAARLTPASRAKYHELSGDIALKEGDFAVAAAAFEKLISAETEAGESPLGLAYSYSRLTKALVGHGDFDSAHDQFTVAVKLLKEGDAALSEQTAIWFGYGHALWKAERHNTAISALEEAFRLAVEAEEDARAVSGIAYFLANSYAQVVQLASLAETASNLFDEAHAAGIEKPEGADEIFAEGQKADELRTRGETAARAAIDWLTRAGESEEMLSRAREDLETILNAGKTIARDEQSKSEPDGDESEESPPENLVTFPFDLGPLEIDDEIYELLDLDFNPGSYDYLEGYQLNSGTWWVCAFGRNGMRELFGFQLIPGKSLAESPIVSVAENEAEVKTVCASMRQFIPARILEYLYGKWDDFAGLGDAAWQQLTALHQAMGGDTLDEFRNYINDAANRERILDDKDAWLARLSPEANVVLTAADAVGGAAEEGHAATAELARHGWTLLTAPAPLDMNQTSLSVTMLLRGAAILVRQYADEFRQGGKENILLAAGTLIEEGETYNGAGHFHAAILLIKEKEYALAFNLLASFAYFSHASVGASAPPALDAALALADLAGWSEIRGALTYLRGLRETDGWPEDMKSACAQMAEKVKAAYNHA